MEEFTEALESLGYTPNEIRAYLTALRLGESVPSLIAKEAQLPRTYAYDLLRDLAIKGLVTSVVRQNKLRYSAVDPQRIRKIQEGRLAKLNAVLPNMEAIYQGGTHRPRMRFYEGRDGIAAVHEELLEARSIDVFGEDKGWIEAFPNWKEHVRNVVRRRIRVRELANHLPETAAYDELYNPELQEMRINKAEWQFESNVFLWGHKTCFITYAPEMHAVIIESAAITNTMRATFEILWEAADRRP